MKTSDLHNRLGKSSTTETKPNWLEPEISINHQLIKVVDPLLTMETYTDATMPRQELFTRGQASMEVSK